MFFKNILKKPYFFFRSLPTNVKNGNSLAAIIVDSNLENTSKISANSKIYWSKIEKYSYVGENSKIMKTKIGKFCSIGSRVEIGVPGHTINRISTSPLFFAEKNIFNENFTEILPESYSDEVIIGNDVWIGVNTLIKPGLSIGHGSIIGMGSIVTHDIPPYEIWAGNPAKKIRDRFSKCDIELLIQSEWWDSDIEVIKKCALKTIEPISFIKELENENSSH